MPHGRRPEMTPGQATQSTNAAASATLPPATHDPGPSWQYRNGAGHTDAHDATSTTHLSTVAPAGSPQGRNRSEMQPASFGESAAAASTGTEEQAPASVALSAPSGPLD